MEQPGVLTYRTVTMIESSKREGSNLSNRPVQQGSTLAAACIKNHCWMHYTGTANHTRKYLCVNPYIYLLISSLAAQRA